MELRIINNIIQRKQVTKALAGYLVDIIKLQQLQISPPIIHQEVKDRHLEDSESTKI